jgi:hypothetical protein
MIKLIEKTSLLLFTCEVVIILGKKQPCLQFIFGGSWALKCHLPNHSSCLASNHNKVSDLLVFWKFWLASHVNYFEMVVVISKAFNCWLILRNFGERWVTLMEMLRIFLECPTSDLLIHSHVLCVKVTEIVWLIEAYSVTTRETRSSYD